MTLLKFLLFSLISVALPTAMAFAHGEDKPGPNGGYLRMPGAFHTELVSKDDSEFFVYLLDIQFQNPDVKSSSLTVTAKANGAEAKLQCEAQSNRFSCKLPESKGKSKKIEQLVVKAKYLNFPEGTSVYDLPLKFEKSVH